MDTRPIAVALLFVAGCGTLGNRLGPDKIQASDFSQDSALIVISAGAPEACRGQYATSLRVYPAGATYDGSSFVGSFNVDNHFVQSDFTTHQGNLSVLKVKPGSYYLAPAFVALKTVRAPKADFSVAAGEIVYLGEYWMPVSCAMNTQSVFRDQEARDMALLKQKNPAFATAKITKRIASSTGFAINEK